MVSEEIRLSTSNKVQRKWNINQLRTWDDAICVTEGDILCGKKGDVPFEFLITWVSDIKEKPRLFCGSFQGTNPYGLSKGMTVAWGMRGISYSLPDYRQGKYLYPAPTHHVYDDYCC